MPSYYDIDEILAEEELVPCTTSFDFAHLAHLDPDLRAHGVADGPSSSGRKRRRRQQSNDDGDGDDPEEDEDERRQRQQHHLPEGSRIKMPFWAADRWAVLGFVKPTLPRHFNKKAREKLEADPGSVDLRSKNERFYMAGMLLVDLIQRAADSAAANDAGNRRRRGAGGMDARAAALEAVRGDALDLRRTLLVTYMGERLRRTYDWSLSASSTGTGDASWSRHGSKLTRLEWKSYVRSVEASRAHERWRALGSRRIEVSATALRARSIVTTTGATNKSAAARSVTPDNVSGSRGGGGGRKRVRAVA